MRRLWPLPLVALLAFAPAAVAERPTSLTVTARAGQVARVADELAAGGLRVQRRDERALQVVAAPRRATALTSLPGAAGAREATTAFADDLVVNQGYDRTGASALEPVADGGSGQVIAILDMGFGKTWATRQAAGELPPPSRLVTRSFDLVGGLAGSNAYGNATNHGELVAQTVYDYAPRAQYLFVDYHTVEDFLAAVDWLVAQRPNIIVHSNSFLEGPFDGTGPEAQAVDRAAAAGVLWFNSADNYAGKHWAGPWADADGDGYLDWPRGNGWSFARNAGQPITFALSWTNPPGIVPSDLDLILERQNPDGSWTQVAGSTDRQSAGLPPAERITGYLPDRSAVFRLRVRLVSGPPPTGTLTLFSREIDLSPLGDAVTGSISTPGDAAGSITVGAVDWRGNALKAYSAVGPTVDGRLKPDLVAPTNTLVAGPTGFRAVGGTSIAAPNAAGAAAVLWATQKAAGVPVTAADVRAELVADALDLGPPGPDAAYGAGLVRVDTQPPTIVPTMPARGQVVRRNVRVGFQALDGAPIASWSVALDGVPLRSNRSGDPVATVVNTRRLADGPHTVQAQARDWPGNTATLSWPFSVDNTVPTVSVPRVTVLPPVPVRLLDARQAPGGNRRKRPRRPRVPPPRPVIVTVAGRDGASRLALRMELRLTDAAGETLLRRRGALRPGGSVRVLLGSLHPGSYRLVVGLTDRAGNARGLGRTFTVG
jgi:hypothetical protein